MPFVGDGVFEGLTRTHRCVETICLGAGACELKANKESLDPAELLKEWYADANEGIARGPWGKELGNMGTKAQPFTYLYKRVFDTEDSS